MSKIKTSSLLDEITGKAGTTIFANKGSGQFESYLLPRKRRSTQTYNETQVRARVSESSKYWYDTLTQAFRDAWELYAPTIPVTTKTRGDIIRQPHGPYSGYTAFIRAQVNLFTSGQLMLGMFNPFAPIGMPPPTPLIDLSAIWNPIAFTIDVFWLPPPHAMEFTRIWLRSKNTNAHAQIAAIALEMFGFAQIPQARFTPGVTITLDKVKGFFDIQGDNTDRFGQVSAPSNLIRNVQVT